MTYRVCATSVLHDILRGIDDSRSLLVAKRLQAIQGGGQPLYLPEDVMHLWLCQPEKHESAFACSSDLVTLAPW